MENYIKLIKEYSQNTYEKMLRNPCGSIKHPFIVPGSQSYNNCLWDWDSWLTDIAVSQIMLDNQIDNDFFIEYEKGSILNFLEHEFSNGAIPIVITSDFARDKFNTEGNIHKPCLAQHIAFIIKKTGESEWIRPYICGLEKFISYYREHCMHKETGLYYWITDEMIGVDNDPCTFYRPDKSSASIYLNCLMYKELMAMSYIFQKLKLDDEKYIKSANNIKNAINEHLWDERNGFYYSADINLRPIDIKENLHSGAPRHWHCLIQRIDVWSGIMAMWAGIATKEQAERMVYENVMNQNTFWARYGICTLSKLEKMYCIKKTGNPSCWLGPIWGISNWMCFKGLMDYGFGKPARELAKKTIILFGRDIQKCGEMHEYYHPDTGEGVNNQGFQNWNLLVNNMIAYIEERTVITEF